MTVLIQVKKFLPRFFSSKRLFPENNKEKIKTTNSEIEMVNLNELPNELLSAILSHLLDEIDSIRPRSNLLPFSLSSTHFSTLASPILNSILRFSSEEQLELYLSARKSNFNLSNWTQSIELLRPSYRKNNGVWESQGGIRKLLNLFSCDEGCGNLTELKLGGIDWTMIDFLLEWLNRSKEKNSKDEVENGDISFGSKLLSISFDFEQRTTRTFLSFHPEQYSEYSYQDTTDTLDSTTKKEGEASATTTNSTSLLINCLTTFPHLQSLRVSHLPSTPPVLYPVPFVNNTISELFGITSKLQKLELIESIISDSTLLSIFSSISKLRHLSIVNCRGFTVAGITSALSLVLPTLESLNLQFDPPISTTYIASPFPTIMSQRITPTSPSRSPFQPSISPLTILISLLDPILPLATSLKKLSITGPLLSLPSLQLALASSLLNLRRLELNNLHFGDTRNLEGIRELWVKSKEKGIVLEGNEFRVWEERMIWAESICIGRADEEQIVVGEEKERIGVESVKKRKRPGVCRE